MKLSSQYALRVALQTMKERCISLQQRISVVEEENQILRSRLEVGRNDTTKNSENLSIDSENLKLKAQVSELNRQKSQLSEHITMVANENRKLWSRLSKIDKKQNDVEMIDDTDLPSATAHSPPRGSANQNLIRSKTFTQHSPNPKLRHKIIPCNNAGVAGESSSFQDLSLEEVALENVNETAAAIVGDIEDEETTTTECDDTNLGFTYLDVDSNDGDFNIEAKKCIEGLHDIHNEALEQRNELNLALTMLESRLNMRNCPDCEKKSKKPEMADKSLETDESITASNEMGVVDNTSSSVATARIDILKEKSQADQMMKMCPMCGKTYSNLVSFDDFRDHVETHFIDDVTDFESSIDRNFEYISHPVGDF